MPNAAYRAANREKIAASAAAYDAAHREEISARKAAWYVDHREEIAAQQAAYYAANREERTASSAAYQAANPEKRRGYKATRRARKLGNSIGLPLPDYKAILDKFGMLCHICTLPIELMTDLHMDHVIPLAKGGPHSADNLRPSHSVCNLKKGTTLLETKAETE
jgi:5-methylcytosine-specific restriction endonuclease McrA